MNTKWGENRTRLQRKFNNELVTTFGSESSSKMVCELSRLLLFAFLIRESVQIYLNTSSDGRRGPIEANPAVWTESGLWGSILEEYVIGSSRWDYYFYNHCMKYEIRTCLWPLKLNSFLSLNPESSAKQKHLIILI